MTIDFNTPFTAIAAPFLRDNVDTDVIMPKQFLKRIDRQGLVDGVFHDLRFVDEGEQKPDFILHHAGYTGAKILVAGKNFGCGSSREHAVWGLVQFGIRAILAPSFSGIFFDNAARNGLLLARLSEPDIARVAETVSVPDTNTISIDVRQRRVSLVSGEIIEFELDGVSQQMLLDGADLIDRTLEHAAAIREFETKHREANPWLITRPDA